jgi:hypothetical protein
MHETEETKQLSLITFNDLILIFNFGLKKNILKNFDVNRL